MPTWGGILAELKRTVTPGGTPDLDRVRRRYLAELHHKTRRNLILYATRFMDPGANLPPGATSIGDEDIHGLMEVIHGLRGPALDLVLHSPGGLPEAAEAFVVYLRSKFDHIRVIVPQAAFSAATMMACAADVIVMGKHSFLGPIDPQLVLQTPLGQRFVPAQAILDQFDRAVQECKDPGRLPAWLPMLDQYGPDLLVQCETASAMAKTLVRDWLASYMLRKDPDRDAKARSIADWLADHGYFKSHSRHIRREDLKARGLVVEDLERDQKEQDLVLSVFHATDHTFSLSGVYKIIENHEGHAWIKAAHLIAAPLPAPDQPPQP